MKALKRTENRTEKILRQLQTEQEPVVLMGAALCGKQYLQILRENGVRVACFADDDTKKQAQEVDGLPVVPTEQLSCMGGRIVIASYGPEKVSRRLNAFRDGLAARLVQPDFYLWEDGLDYFAYYAEHCEEIEAADALLADERSHQVFHNLLQYKISREPGLIAEIRDDVGLQYFDPKVIHFGTEEVFLDLGAYIGDTVEAFANHVKGRYQGIVALEPDMGNFAKLQATARGLRNVECYPYGIGASDGTARFSSDDNWTSSVSENGETEIEIRSVDSLMSDRRLTFIKADIEGLEKEMLAGARNVISAQAPQMAIAVYHCKEDIFWIINTINDCKPGYVFYLRHYTEMPIDTVLYAVHQEGE